MAVNKIKVTGAPGCRHSFVLRDFLKRSSIEFDWNELKSDEEARRLPGVTDLADLRLPVVTIGNSINLYRPSVRDLAERLGLLSKPRLEEYDLSIYGAGPAGLSAAVYAASEGLKTILIERGAVGGQAGSSSRIENFLGFPDGVSGAELADRARRQALKFGCEIYQLQEGVYAQFVDNKIHANLADGAQIVARANICATGVEYSRLEIPNENRFVGAGIYYGAGYSEAVRMTGQTVYVVGGANSAGQAAMYFSQFAERVIMLVRGKVLSGTMSQYMISRVTTEPKIAIRYQTAVTAADGDNVLQQITIHDRNSESEEKVNASSLFVCIGGKPNTEWARDTDIVRDSGGYLLTGTDLFVDGKPPIGWPLRRPPMFLETSVPGSFAAGDVRHASVKRYATAVGEGAMAVTFVHHYLAETR